MNTSLFTSSAYHSLFLENRNLFFSVETPDHLESEVSHTLETEVREGLDSLGIQNIESMKTADASEVLQVLDKINKPNTPERWTNLFFNENSPHTPTVFEVAIQRGMNIIIENAERGRYQNVNGDIITPNGLSEAFKLHRLDVKIITNNAKLGKSPNKKVFIEGLIEELGKLGGTIQPENEKKSDSATTSPPAANASIQKAIDNSLTPEEINVFAESFSGNIDGISQKNKELLLANEVAIMSYATTNFKAGSVMNVTNNSEAIRDNTGEEIDRVQKGADPTLKAIIKPEDIVLRESPNKKNSQLYLYGPTVLSGGKTGYINFGRIDKKTGVFTPENTIEVKETVNPYTELKKVAHKYLNSTGINLATIDPKKISVEEENITISPNNTTITIAIPKGNNPRGGTIILENTTKGVEGITPKIVYNYIDRTRNTEVASN